MFCRLFTGNDKKDFYDALFKALKKDNKVYMVVPEQTTFQHEVALEKMRGERSLWNLEIVSFQRLADYCVRNKPIDNLGRNLLIFSVLNEKRDELLSLHPKAVSPGFIDDISLVVSEIYRNGISPSALMEYSSYFSSNTRSGDLGNKLKDLSVICSTLEEKGYTDISGRLFLLSDRIREEHMLNKSVFFFDDFSDFSAAEISVINALAEQKTEMNFFFAYRDDLTVFHRTKKSMEKINRICSSFGIRVLHNSIENSLGDDSLVFLRNHFFKTNPGKFIGNECNIDIFAAETKKSELREVAEIIRSLIDSKDADYSDMGICLRDTKTYEREIEKVFSAYRIPYYLNRSVPLSMHPVFRYAYGLLRVVSEKWSYASVFSLLKSGMFPIDRENCDRFENYCLAHGMKGKRFYQKKDWVYVDEREGENLEEINKIRKTVSEFLLPFVNEFGESAPVEKYAALVWNFVEESDCVSAVLAWQELETESDRLQKSAELSAGFSAFSTLLDQIVSAFQGKELVLRDFCELMKMGALSISVRTIPSETGTVQFYDLGKNIPENKSYLFLCGANEGIIPSSYGDGGFLNINDRSMLNEYSDSWIQDKNYFYEDESLLLYRVFSSVKNKLFISYHMKDEEGISFPSPIIDSLTKLYPDINVRRIFEKEAELGCFDTLEDILEALPSSLKKYPGTDWDIIRDMLLANSETKDRTENLLEAVHYSVQSKALSSDVLNFYPGKEIRLSVSSAELFRSCPFSYFASYGLNLRERKLLTFSSPDLGSLFHNILCEIMKDASETAIGTESVFNVYKDRIQSIVGEKLSQLYSDNLFPEEQMNYIIWILSENIRFILKMISGHAAEGDIFVPGYFEVDFGKKRASTIEIPSDYSGEPIHFSGTIDRIDTALVNGERYYRIVDYKSSGKEINLSDIYNGSSLQLPLYSIVAEKVLKAGTPGGFFYQSMKDDFLSINEKDISKYFSSRKDDSKIKEELLKDMSLNGYVIEGKSVSECYNQFQMKNSKILSLEDYRLIEKHTRKIIGKIGGEIFRGNNEIHPVKKGKESGCDFCPYHSLCFFEPGFDIDYNYEIKLDDPNVKNIIRTEEKA